MKKRCELRRLGGCYQLSVEAPEDLQFIQSLDEALWMATSVPVATLTCDPAFLHFVDFDDNGRVRTDEIREAQSWLFRMLSDRSRVGVRDGALKLAAIDTSHPEGAALRAAAERILSNIGAEGAEEITLAQVRDRQRIMSGATTNGDGIIPADAVAEQDAELAAFIRDITDSLGSAADASGQPGANAELLGAFRQQAGAHLEWLERGRIPAGQSETEVMVWGPETPQAFEPVEELWDKLEEYFALCALCSLDERVAAKYRLDDEEIEGLPVTDSQALSDRLRNAPLARPTADERLDLADGVNPAYRQALEHLAERVVLRVAGRGGRLLSRAGWEEIKRTFSAFREWRGSDQGRAVARLGEDKLRCYLDGPLGGRLQEIIEQDRAVAEELKEVGGLEKLLLYQQWLLELVNNSVSFPHFYDPDARALVEMGTLIMDGRHFTLNIRVSDRAAHKAVAARSHICLMYVRVTEKKAGESFEVATAVTSGTTETLCVGKPGIFFTTDGREWDAVVVDLLPNPVSLGEAVKHPFKRLAGFIGAQWEKLTARFYTDAEKNIGTGIDSLQKPAAAKGGKASAARDLLLGGGVAFAALGGVATYLTKTIAEIGPAGILKVVGTVALVILATTVITAVVKLRRRNLSTVLEASGWAVNTHMRLTRRIGKIFTFVPKHPGEARLRRRDDVDRLLKKIPAAGHRPLAWVMAVVLAAVLGVTAGLAAAPYVSRGLVRFLGMESALSDTQVLRKTRPGALRPEPKPGSGAPQESG